MERLFGAPPGARGSAGGSGSSAGGQAAAPPPPASPPPFPLAPAADEAAAAAAAAAASATPYPDIRFSVGSDGPASHTRSHDRLLPPGGPPPSPPLPLGTAFPSGDASPHITSAQPRTPTRRGGGSGGGGSGGGGRASSGGGGAGPSLFGRPSAGGGPPPAPGPAGFFGGVFGGKSHSSGGGGSDGRGSFPGAGGAGGAGGVTGAEFFYPDVRALDSSGGGGPGRGPGVPRASPLQMAAAASGRAAPRAIWAPKKAPRPLKTVFSPLAFVIFLGFLAATGYYYYIRVKFTLDMGKNTWWGIIVLIAETIGLTAVIPYGMVLWLHTEPWGSPGLPRDNGRVVLPPEKRFNVHILVPCYKETLEVISATVGAALGAHVPPGVTRTVYLCDDGKDPKKAALIASLGPAARYVTGRTRTPGEINGKSANVNNCLRNVIYPETHDQPDAIPWTEMVVVFDADMQAKPQFLLKILEVMWDDSVALCLSPQAFSNINPKADIFNNINQQFWEYILPGFDAFGYVACTGTNFCLRARALATVGWFPEYTITEDYALSMEFKSAGFKGRYLNEYLAVGEAPDEIRNVCRQRSRWTKGHMQIFFSRRCPLFNGRLSLLHKWLYTNGTWSYFCTIITTAVFILVPFNSLVFGLHPVTFSMEFALAATIYLPMNFLLMNYVRRPAHLKGQWLAQVSNHVLCFTYMKAVFNTLLSLFGVKEKAGFKATKKAGEGTGKDKKKDADAAPSAAAAAAALSGFAPAGPPRAPGPSPLAAAHAAALRPPPPRAGAHPSVWGAPPPGAKRPPPRPALPPAPRRGCWLWVNTKTLEGALDPLALALSLCISLAAVGAGIYSIIKSKVFNIQVKDWQDFARLFTEGRLDVYTLVPIFWALYNAIPPALFFVYFFTKGRVLQWTCSTLHVIGTLLAAACILCLWLALLIPYKGPKQSTAFAAVSQAIVDAVAKRQHQQGGQHAASG